MKGHVVVSGVLNGGTRKKNLSKNTEEKTVQSYYVNLYVLLN